MPAAALSSSSLCPDPKREDSGKDLDLPYITRRTIRKLEKAIGRRLYFVAAVHNADHTPIRHVHGIFLVKGRLSREHFRVLQEVARAESTARLSFRGRVQSVGSALVRSPLKAMAWRRACGEGGTLRT
jgi:hypothetical protein